LVTFHGSHHCPACHQRKAHVTADRILWNKAREVHASARPRALEIHHLLRQNVGAFVKGEAAGLSALRDGPFRGVGHEVGGSVTRSVGRAVTRG
jgi:hypothetical protein